MAAQRKNLIFFHFQNDMFVHNKIKADENQLYLIALRERSIEHTVRIYMYIFPYNYIH